MPLPSWVFAPVLALFLAVPATRAAEPSTATLVVRVKSIDGLFADAKYLAGLAGQAEQATQLEKMIPAFVGPKGLAGTGLDTSRPWGMYAILKPELPTSPVVVLIPVAEEKAFVASLEMFAGFVPGANVSIAKGDDGLYTVKSPAAPFEAYFTVADGYAYITALRKDAISKANRLAAAKMLAGDDKTVLDVTARLDTVDPQFKQMALGQFENQIAAAKERKSPHETPAQTKLKMEVIDYLAGQVRSFLTDAQALQFRVSLDRANDDASAELSLTAKSGSPLAQQIAAAGLRPSRFGAWSGAAGQATLNVSVPEVLRTAVAEALEEGFKEAQNRQKDTNKKNLAQRLHDVLAPTVKAGELDAFVVLVGPNGDGKYTLAGGIKLRDATNVEQMLRDLAPMIPDPKAKEAIRFDAETIDGVKIHQIKPYDLDAEARRIFGDAPTALVAFPADAQVAAFGPEAGEALKRILASRGKTAGPFHVEGSIRRLAALDKDKGMQAKQIAHTAFGPDPKTDIFSASIDGGAALKVRASIKTHVIKFGVKMDEAGKSNNQ
jgi:hypothetical protein